jgi:hypothetical protein
MEVDRMEPRVHVEFNPHVRGVNPNVWGSARLWGLAHGYTMGSVVTAALAEFLERHAADPPRYPVPTPDAPTPAR